MLCSASSTSDSQDLEAVDLGREPRGDRTSGRVAGGSDVGGGPGGVGHDLGPVAVAAQELAALADGVDVAFDQVDRLQRGARHAQELVVHAHELLADDVQPAARQQVVHVGDAAGDRVVDRDHGVARLALAHGGERVLERVAGQGVELGEGLAAGEVRVGAGHALEGDRPLRVGGFAVVVLTCRPPGSAAPSPGRPECRRRTAPQSTRRTPMLMPFSRARSCSRRSRCSSGLGGRAANRSRASRVKA